MVDHPQHGLALEDQQPAGDGRPRSFDPRHEGAHPEDGLEVRAQIAGLRYSRRSMLSSHVVREATGRSMATV
ncbi:hypothetical protein [Modestobacter sp. I12A-02662]|uniref:hypothetical protein n=1 Tax=Modestobacter sp. I12A-02662 TaxID=1730496 RepID=UPI0034DEBE04